MSRSKPHQLRQAYCNYVRNHYHIIISGDATPERTELVAAKVAKLGIDYNTFVELACSYWADKCHGAPYPYWNVITCDRTFTVIRRIIALGDSLNVDDRASQFQIELGYASQYLDWLAGQAPKPAPPPQPSSTEIKIRVAEYLCQLYGVPCLTSAFTGD